MSDQDTTEPENLSDTEYMPPLPQATALGIQHVLAMFAGNITVPLLIALAAGPQYINVLIQIALLAAGIATLIQTIGIGPVGSRLPVVQGTSFAYVGILTAAIKGGATLAAVFGATIVGGIFQVILGYFIPQIRKFIPPIVSGVVVMTIGFTLLPVGIKYSAGCGAYPAPFCKNGFGDPSNWGMALFVIIVTLLLRKYGKGIWSAASIFFGLCIGYIVAIPLGMVNDKKIAAVGKADWIGLPDQWFGLDFTSGQAIALMGLMIIMAFITTIETVGDISGITMGGANREPTDKELKGGIMADGVGSAIVALFGGLPNTSYSQNVGLISYTKVMSRHVVSIGAVFLILFGLMPKLAAVIGALPQPVLGGASVVMFGMIASAGMKLVAHSGFSSRNMLIVAVSMGLGLGLWQVNQLTGGAGFGPIPPESFAAWSIPLFVSGIVVSGLVAALMNAFMGEEEI
jgi:NCS2 family nucleobase:cation symporter-2